VEAVPLSIVVSPVGDKHDALGDDSVLPATRVSVSQTMKRGKSKGTPTNKTAINRIKRNAPICSAYKKKQIK
jgi:hypothetical protein